MTQTQHTPGPWTAEHSEIAAHPSHWVRGSDGFLIAKIGADARDEVEQSANARLIASAPALLEALKACVAGPYTIYSIPEERRDLADNHLKAIHDAAALLSRMEDK